MRIFDELDVKRAFIAGWHQGSYDNNSEHDCRMFISTRARMT